MTEIVQNGVGVVMNGNSHHNGINGHDDDSSDSDADLNPNEYEVENILDYKKTRSEELYFIKWKNWEDKHNTWEPEDNLTSCPELRLAFYLKRKSEFEEDSPSSGEGQPTKRRRIQVPPDPRGLDELLNEYFNKVGLPSSEFMKKHEDIWRKNKKINRWQQATIISKIRNHEGMSEQDQMKLEQQLTYAKLDIQQKNAKEELKKWETELNVISGGKPKITIENEIDFCTKPRNFTFINDYIGNGVTIPDDPPFGCHCTTNCSDSSKECWKNVHTNTKNSPYNHYKRLRVPIGTPIYECNKACTCDASCDNRVVQHGSMDLNLCIFRTQNRGWGVKTLKTIKKGTFVFLYIGEIIKNEEADLRGKTYDSIGCTYLFDLDFSDNLDNLYTIDACNYGNISHFVNHSCEPNLGVFAVWINCLDPNLPMLALFAQKDIKKGEELTFDYRNQNGDGEEDRRLGEKCLCGAEGCRGVLF